MIFNVGDWVRLKPINELQNFPDFISTTYNGPSPLKLKPVGIKILAKHDTVTLLFKTITIHIDVNEFDKILRVTGRKDKLYFTTGLSYEARFLDLVRPSDDSILTQEQRIIQEIWHGEEK